MDRSDEQWLEAVDPAVLRRRRQRIALALGALLLLVIVGVLAYRLAPRPTSTDELRLAAQAAVAHELQPRGKLFFNSPSETQVVSEGPGQFLVRGWVRDVAADGRSWYYLYSVSVIAGPSEYTCRDISLSEQF